MKIKEILFNDLTLKDEFNILRFYARNIDSNYRCYLDLNEALGDLFENKSPSEIVKLCYNLDINPYNEMFWRESGSVSKLKSGSMAAYVYSLWDKQLLLDIIDKGLIEKFLLEVDKGKDCKTFRERILVLKEELPVVVNIRLTGEEGSFMSMSKLNKVVRFGISKVHKTDKRYKTDRDYILYSHGNIDGQSNYIKEVRRITLNKNETLTTLQKKVADNIVYNAEYIMKTGDLTVR